MRRPHLLSSWPPAAAILVLGLLLVPLMPAAPARGAEDGLRIVTDATYEVRPGDGLVRVTIDATATNTTPDTPDGRTSYTGLTFAVQPGATRISAASGEVVLPLVIGERTDQFTQVELTYHQQVFFGDVYRYRITYELPDAGGAPDRDIRVTPSVVAFPVWAFGTSGVRGSSVSVRLPAGYTTEIQGGPLNEASNDTQTTLSATDLPDPFAFFAYVSADRPGAFVETQTSVDIGGSTAPVIVRAWEDDPAWGERTSDLLQRGIPALTELIGLPYPVSGRLRVEEAATSRLGEYAGTYNDLTELISIRYDADPIVGLHEAAHIWFNDGLLRGRWIGEAWAEWYAVQAAADIGESGTVYELTDADLEHRIPLNDWGAFGVEDLSVEDFAYAATYRVAQLVAERTDLDGLRRVWQAVEEGEMTYQPRDAEAGARPETGVSSSQEDWQRLLDLLEERTGAAYDDLWREWVTNDQQDPLLDDRAAARIAYEATVEAAGDWQLPRDLRFDLGAWRFDEVGDELEVADEVLDQRAVIAERAAALDLDPSDALREAFERNDGMEAARAAATAELATLDLIRRAEADVAAPATALESIGLIGADPAAHVATARDAYETGDLDRTDAESQAALEVRDEADAAGRLRVGIAGGSILGADLLAMAVLSARRRSRRRARAAEAAVAAATASAQPEP
ncbi:MAG TPA: hypothetical protein VFQ81_00855 [Candidatus Limnocylindria bacterium]|nr:hypothetical protein [Candidatus Limnocylindria bacterium]